MKNTTQQPLKWKWTGLIEKSGKFQSAKLQGRVAQSVTCLTADTCLSADIGVASLISARSHSFGHEIISTVILLPSTDSRRVVVSYKRKYVHKVLVNCLVDYSLPGKKMGLGELTVPTWP